MTAHLSLASDRPRPRSRSQPRRRASERVDGDRLIVDLSSLKSSLLDRRGSRRSSLRRSPASPTGGGASTSGLTKSTKSTNGTWSTLDDRSGYHRARDEAAAQVRRRDMAKLDDSGEGWGRLSNDEKRERTKGKGWQADGASRAVVPFEREAAGRGRSRSRPRALERAIAAKEADDAVARGRSASRPRDAAARSRSRSRPRPHDRDDVSSLASSRRSGAVSVAAAATLAARRGRSRPRDRAQGDDNMRGHSLPREAPKAFERGEADRRRERSASRSRVPANATPVRRRHPQSRPANSASSARSVGTASAAFRRLRRPVDRRPASGDAHHPRRGSQYRHGEGRRGSWSRSPSPHHQRGGIERRLDGKNRKYGEGISPDSRGGRSGDTGGTGRATVRTSHHPRRHGGGRARGSPARNARGTFDSLRRSRSPRESPGGAGPRPVRRGSAHDEMPRSSQGSPRHRRPQSQPPRPRHRGRSPLTEAPSRREASLPRGQSQSQPRGRARSQPPRERSGAPLRLLPRTADDDNDRFRAPCAGGHWAASRSPASSRPRGGTPGRARNEARGARSPFAAATRSTSQSPAAGGSRRGGTPGRARSFKALAALPFDRSADEDNNEGEEGCRTVALRSSATNGAASCDPTDDRAALDENGCCAAHPFVRLRRPTPGGGWRTLSRTCPLCADEAAERDTRDAVGAILGRSTSPEVERGGAPPRPLERRHSRRSAASARRGSPLAAEALEDRAAASVQSSPGDEGGEVDSITPSFLESASEDSGDSDSDSDRSSDASSMGSDSRSGPMEDPMEANSLGEPISPQLRLPALEQQESDVGSRPPPQGRRASSVVAKNEDGASKPVDMDRVQNALRKIKSMETMAAGESDASSAPSSEDKAATTNKASKKPSSSTTKSKPSSKGASRRDPPPPPPRRTSGAKSVGTASAHSGGSRHSAPHGASMAVLNPHPEPELGNDTLPLVEYAPQPQPPPQPTGLPLANTFPTTALMEAAPTQPVDKSKDWLKYTTDAVRREKEETDGDGTKKSKRKGRVPARHATNEREKLRSVKMMPFTDQFGDFGMYTGQVDEDGRPDGKGSMKYENGVYYEGAWTAGCQDCRDKMAAATYERIRGGFTSWSGKGKSGAKHGMVLPWNARKNDANDAGEKANVRGMDWTDLNGSAGRYTGEINGDQLPHGNGMMKYDFGLIAEGEWVNGVLKEGPQDRLIGVATAMNGGQSVTPNMINSGMSVGPGANGFAGGAVSVLGGGGISVGPGLGGGMSVVPSVYGGGMPMMPYGGGMNPMMAMANQSRQATQHAVVAHQNAMLKGMYGGAGSVYGGAGSVYGGQPMAMPMPVSMPMQQQPMMIQQQPQGDRPPVPEIKLG